MDESDRLFKGFLRLLISSLHDAEKETDIEKRNAKLVNIIKNLQNTLED